MLTIINGTQRTKKSVCVRKIVAYYSTSLFSQPFMSLIPMLKMKWKVTDNEQNNRREKSWDRDLNNKRKVLISTTWHEPFEFTWYYSGFLNLNNISHWCQSYLLHRDVLICKYKTQVTNERPWQFLPRNTTNTIWYLVNHYEKYKTAQWNKRVP